MVIQDAKVRDVSFILVVVCINVTQISFFVKCYMVLHCFSCYCKCNFWFWSSLVYGHTLLTQRLEEEILKLNHLRDRASENGRRKEYPLLYETLVPFGVLVFTMHAQTIFCLNATFENTLRAKSFALISWMMRIWQPSVRVTSTISGYVLDAKVDDKGPVTFSWKFNGLVFTPYFFARSSISTFYVLLVLFMKFVAWPGCVISFSLNT